MLTPQQALKQYFGYDQFREGQEPAIQRVLNGQHTLLVMPTGSGKSIAYQLPALLLPGLTLVVSPLIALMKDQVDSMTEAGIIATFINSSLPTDEVNVRLRAVREGHVKLLYIAPERLRSRQFTRALAQVKISLLAVDEAHCISQWGHDFRPDYLQIGPIWQAMGQPTLLATTATATPAVQKDVLSLLGLTNAQAIVTGFNRPNLTFRVKPAPDDRLKRQFLQDLLTHLDGSAIIYAATRRNADEVADFIRTGLRLPAEAYHAGLDRDLRHRVQTDFMADRLKIVVATNAFGMGIDKPTVRAVIHYNLPATVEAYYQEAGRAGRDGLPAECVLLFAPDDQGLQEWLIQSDTPAYGDLEQTYTLLARAAGSEGEVYFAAHQLAELTHLHPVKLRVTLSELELAGVILHLGDEAGHSHWKVLPPAADALRERAKAVERRAQIRLDLLSRILDYAYLTTCRRQFLLDYFGDTTPPQSPRCCDNHAAASVDSLPKAVTPQEWLPLIVLETARSLSQRPVGRQRLTQLLSGSQAKGMEEFGYTKHRFYGKFKVFSQSQITALINALIAARYLRFSGSDRPILTLTPLGSDALKSRVALPISIPGLTVETETKPRPNRPERGRTVKDTLDLFRQGLTPAQIAVQRGLTESTIYTHLARLISEGQVELRQVIPADLEAQIAKAIVAAETTTALSPIKALLPVEVSYGQIECVLAAYVNSPDDDHQAEIVEEPSPPPQSQKEPSLPLNSSPLAVNSPEPPPSSPALSPLFDTLRQWRTAEAKKRGVSAFIVFSNKVLEAIATRGPLTLDELAQIPGVGPNKLTEYGEAALKIVADTKEQILNTQPAQSSELQMANSNEEQITNETPLPAVDDGVKGHEAENRPLSIVKRQALIPEHNVENPLEVILAVVADLDSLLSPASLAQLLTAAPGDIVPFSDHASFGTFYSILTADDIASQIDQAVHSGRLTLTRYQKLVLTAAS